jgi:hypothetical protein
MVQGLAQVVGEGSDDLSRDAALQTDGQREGEGIIGDQF